jgi:hypothetical protein
MARFGFVCASAAVVLASVGCSSASLPGTMLGTYRVTAQSETNSCNLAAPNPWQFDVQMSQDGSLLYWSWMDGSPALSGTLSGTSATIVAGQQANVDGIDGGFGPCTMQRQDNLQVNLGTGMPPSAFTGTISYVFSVTAGSDCSDQLAASGGQYAALPCTLEYTTTATRQQ